MRMLTPQPSAADPILELPEQYLSKLGARVWGWTETALVVLAPGDERPVLVSASSEELVCSCQRGRNDPKLCLHQAAALELYHWPAPLLPRTWGRSAGDGHHAKRSTDGVTSAAEGAADYAHHLRVIPPPPGHSQPGFAKFWYAGPPWVQCRDCGLLWQPPLRAWATRPRSPSHECAWNGGAA
jgi:hypothetical protein